MEATWLGRPASLLDRPLDFFPRPAQTPPQRAASLARLCLYVAVAVGAYRKQLLAWSVAGLGVAVALTTLLAGSDAARYADAAPRDNTGGPRGPDAGACTMPTPHNPFGNALLTDIGHADFAPACSLDTPGVADKQREFFNRGLVRSIYDVYERQNSQRQFMTLPSPTGVADMEAVRAFLYGTHLNCKSNMKDCTSEPTCKDNPQACRGFFP